MKKVAVLTGANSELTETLYKILKEKNIDVVVLYHNDTLIKDADYLLKCDLTNETNVKKTFSKIAKKYPKINYLINIAALCNDSDILEKSGKEFLKVLNTNVVGPFLTIKYASELIDNGVVVNISSTDGIDTGNIYNIDYSASKSALNTMTTLLSKRFSNIRIVALAPNFINTKSVRNMDNNFLNKEMKRIGQKRILETSEVAQKIYEILITPSFSSGIIIRMDGK